jgi:hypothetical protein
MATNSAASDNTCDRGIIIIDDNLHYPPVIKEFFSSLCLDMERNRWSSKCKICSISITDTYKTTSNFLKHLKNKHQPMFDEWQKSNDQSAKDKNQPKINQVFNPDREICKYFSCFKRRSTLFLYLRFNKQQTTTTVDQQYNSKSHSKYGSSIINCRSCFVQQLHERY